MTSDHQPCSYNLFVMIREGELQGIWRGDCFSRNLKVELVLVLDRIYVPKSRGPSVFFE